jgi:hypothetical protein
MIPRPRPVPAPGVSWGPGTPMTEEDKKKDDEKEDDNPDTA